MVRIRPRQPATVAGRPLHGEHVPPPEELDELAGAEAFGARPDVDPDDPFGTGAAGARRGREPDRSRLAGPALVAAAVVLVLGLLSLLLGLADDDDEDARSDDVSTDATTSTTRASVATSSTTTATSAVGSSTSTTSGFGPGTTSTTVARPTVTTLRPSTTLTATTLPANRDMDVEVTVRLDGVPVTEVPQGTTVEISVAVSDPDAQPLASDCLRVEVEGGLDQDVIVDDTCAGACPSPVVSQPEGGTRTTVIPYTFEDDGRHTIVVSATAGRPGCGNPYADSIEDHRTSVDVDPAN